MLTKAISDARQLLSKILPQWGSLSAGLRSMVIGTVAFLFGAVAANNLSTYKAEIHPDLDHILGVQYYIPVAALPSSAIPANALPSSAIPANAIPANALPSSAIPANAIPANALPSSAIPANFIEKMGGKLMILPPPDFGKEICGGWNCGSETNHVFYSHSGSVTVSGTFYGSGVELSGPPVTEPPPATTAPIVTVAPLVTVPPPVTEAVAETGSRCDLFGNINMSITYLDWQPGAPLTFYIKMPGGVPGFDRKISGDNDPWNYTARVGSFKSPNCRQDYKERLYCTISLPSIYSNSYHPISLNVNGCEASIYNNQSADLPALEKVVSSGAGGGGSGGSVTDACGTAPGSSDPSFPSWCSCKGGAMYYPANYPPMCQLPEVSGP